MLFMARKYHLLSVSVRFEISRQNIKLYQLSNQYINIHKSPTNPFRCNWRRSAEDPDMESQEELNKKPPRTSKAETHEEHGLHHFDNLHILIYARDSRQTMTCAADDIWYVIAAKLCIT